MCTCECEVRLAFQPIKPSRELFLQPAFTHAGPIWSAVGNRWGFRTVSVIGSFLAAGSLVSCFYIHEYGLFIFVYGVVLGEMLEIKLS